jgi:hypothetical protein
MITSLRKQFEPRQDEDAAASIRGSRSSVVYGSEAVVGALVVGLGLLAWAGLALAHASRYSLTAALGLAVAGCVLLLLVAWRVPGRPRLALDPDGLTLVAGLALVAGLLFFPGFPYGAGDKDPGVYVEHGIAIARTGSYALNDPVLDQSRIPSVTMSSAGARFPGIWIRDRAAQRIVPQFYHLWPALLASAFRLGGFTGLVNVAPLAGLLAVLAVALLVRRAFEPAGRWAGLVTGSLAGLLLATNMLEVWQVKYQSAEAFTQALIAGGLLAVVIAIRTGWRSAAGVAGLLLGLSFLARPDSLLLLLIAVGIGCALLVVRRFDQRATWFFAGLAVTLPHALLQAYSFARGYSQANGLPTLRGLAVVVAVPVALAVAIRVLLPRLGTGMMRLVNNAEVQRWCGLALALVAGCLLVLGLLRPRLFGPAYIDYNGRIIRSYSEHTMRRLSWFLTLPGLALMWTGLALVVLRRWRAATWVIVLPTLLLPVYAFDARNSSRLMWWNRRFVPVALPEIVILIAVALTVGLLWTSGRLRWPLRLAAGTLTVFLVAVFLSQSLPLRQHHEFAGTFEITEEIARTAGGRQGVFLWAPAGYMGPPSLFGSPVWLQEGQISALIGNKPDPAAYVRSFVHGFPRQPVFVVAQGTAPPSRMDSLRLTPVDHIDRKLPMWQESDVQRPSHARTWPVDFTIWRVGGT